MARSPTAWALLQAAPYLCALLTLLSGLAALAGWMLDAEALRRVVPGWASMQPLTAIGLVLSGIGLAACGGRPANGGRRLAAAASSVAVMALAAASLYQDLAGTSLGLDTLLFAERALSQPIVHPGRMSTATALALFLNAGALFALSRRRPPRALYPGAAVGGLVIALVGLFGHVYSPAALYGVFPFRSTGILSASGLTALAAGLLAARPNRSGLQILGRDSIGGVMARTSLPLMVLAPLGLIGMVFTTTVLFGLHADFRPAAFTAIASTLLAGLGLWTARRMDRLDRERRSAEEARRASEEWLTHTVQVAPVSMVQIGLDGRFQRVNPHFSDITGFDAAELLRMTPEDITQRDDRRRDLDAFARLRAGEVSRYTIEKRYVRKDGRLVWVLVTVTLVRDAATGEPRHFLSVIEDIDERKQAERALRIRSERLALISDVTSRLLQAGDPSDLLKAVFGRISRILEVDGFLHYAVAEGGLDLVTHGGIAPDMLPRIRRLATGDGVCGAVAAKGLPVFRHDVQNAPDPEARYIRDLGFTAYVCHPLEAEGRLVGTLSFGSRRVRRFDIDTLGVLRTICDQIALAMVRHQGEQALMAAKDEAERAVVAKAKFLAAASHDLRQPVQSLMLLTSAMGGWADGNPAAVKLLEHQDLALNALKDLLDGLLDIARLDAGAVEPEIADMPVMTLLSRLQAAYAPRAQARELRFRMVPCKAWIRSDATLLGRILSNFLENAVKYTGSGSILIGCRRRGNRLRVVVADTGIGIAEEHLNEVFEEFSQIGNPQRDRNLGLGLGLAIVKRLATLLGHRIYVRSVPGKGSAFAIDLPLAEVREAEGVGPAAAAGVPEDRDSGVIALVDDEVLIRMALETAMEEWGFQTFSGASAEEVVRALRAGSRRPDLVVSDYHLSSGKTGLEVIRTLRGLYGASLPCILLTGDTAADRVAEAREAGAVLLQKPIKPAELRDAVRALREGGPAGGSPPR
ncbi:PAS domain S-box protein [Azospirillum sp. SYSU D00513]|uniref:hybrid sensor histidine kinase/response regulator n=1 Tax=Azospirillum sp. SYSU D00513 TaxID=2812561 RepID=UPI001A977A50|nr:PAS domain S-box protein [Azospirillum sp. SYSU D00513]